MSKGRVKRYIFITDTHAPNHDKKAWKAVLSYIQEINPDGVIHLGDVGDFVSISHWMSNKKLELEGKRLKQEIGAAKQLLFDINAVTKRSCEKIVVVGNHDGWVTQYVNANPALEGYVDINKEYASCGWKVIPENGVGKLGKLTYFHGFYTPQFHTKKTVLQTGKSCIYGHVHDHQAYTLEQMEGEHIAISIGCLCKKDMPYLKNRPTKWVHGFAVCNLWPDGKCYTLDFIKIVNGKFARGGKMYG